MSGLRRHHTASVRVRTSQIRTTALAGRSATSHAAKYLAAQLTRSVLFITEAHFASSFHL